VLRKNDVLDVGDSPKPQVAVPKTFSDLVWTRWQDHAWSFGADWIIKWWIEPEDGFTHDDVEGSQNQEERPDGGTTGGSGGLRWSEEPHPTQGTKGSTRLFVKWIANGARMTTAATGTGEHSNTPVTTDWTGRGKHSNAPVTTEWMATLMMVRALLACVLTCLQSTIIRCTSGRIDKPEQRSTRGGKTFDESGTRQQWPNLEAETREEATNDKPQLPNMNEKCRV